MVVCFGCRPFPIIICASCPTAITLFNVGMCAVTARYSGRAGRTSVDEDPTTGKRQPIKVSGTKKSSCKIDSLCIAYLDENVLLKMPVEGF